MKINGNNTPEFLQLAIKISNESAIAKIISA
jgi:hypothetical protein